MRSLESSMSQRHERRKEVARGWGRGNGGQCVDRAAIREDGRVLAMNGGDGRTRCDCISCQ